MKTSAAAHPIGHSPTSRAEPAPEPEPKGASGKTILVLTPQFPYPPHQGTTIRNYNLLVGLAQRNRVHLLSFGDPHQNGSTPLHDLCRSVRIVQPPQRSMAQRLKGLVFSRLPDMALRLPSAEFAAALQEALRRIDADVVEVEGIELAQYLFQTRAWRDVRQRPLLVYDDHNAEYVLQQRAFETDVKSLHPRRWLGAAYSFVQWRRLRGYERRACKAADRVVAVSKADGDALRRLVDGLDPVIVPNGVDVRHYTEPVAPHAAQPGASLVFTGKMDFRPNVDAALWFAQEVLPLVRREAPETRFCIVGRDPHPRLAPLRDRDGVTLTGWVADVRPYIAQADVYVIPLRIGGGTRLKVLEAMAMGKAIVSTTLGFEGFDLAPGQELLAADTPAQFARAILTLLHDPERRARMGQAARSFAASRYDWQAIVPTLEKAYD